MNVVPFALTSMGFVSAALWLAFYWDNDDSKFQELGLPALLLSAGVLTIGPWLFKQVPKLRSTLESATTAAEQEVRTDEAT